MAAPVQKIFDTTLYGMLTSHKVEFSILTIYLYMEFMSSSLNIIMYRMKMACCESRYVTVNMETCNCEYVLSIKICVWWLFISSFANTHEWRTSSLMKYTSNSRFRQNHISKWDHKIRNSVHNVISNTDATDGESSCWIQCSTKCRWQNNAT